MISLLFGFISYLIGAIPSGWLLAYCAGINDITKHGSGNIGATNVGRLLGIRYFIFALLLDCCKAYMMLEIIKHFDVAPLTIFLSSVGLLVGNSISIFLCGKGGKGIATSLGILLAYNPWILLYLISLWLPAALITRTMGISCVVGLLGLPIYALVSSSSDFYFIILAFFISIWGLWRHESNIRRYLSKKATS